MKLLGIRQFILRIPLLTTGIKHQANTYPSVPDPLSRPLHGTVPLVRPLPTLTPSLHHMT